MTGPYDDERFKGSGIGGPGLSGSDLGSARETRQQLLQLGLPAEHLVVTEARATTELSLEDLTPASYSPEFTPLVQRFLKLLHGGRGLAVAVTSRLEDSFSRERTALQIAVGLRQHGREVTLVDAHFSSPGLGGLLPDPHAEGIIDMVRFGRSCRGVLRRPVPEGPSLLAVGSFPTDDPMPFDAEALRSILHRVSLHCEVALFVAPHSVRDELNPIIQTCGAVVHTHIVVDHEAGLEFVQEVDDLHRSGTQVLGVVVHERTAVARREPPAPTAGGARPEAMAAPILEGPDESLPSFPPEDAAVPPRQPDPAFGSPVSPLPSWDDRLRARGEPWKGQPGLSPPIPTPPEAEETFEEATPGREVPEPPQMPSYKESPSPFEPRPDLLQPSDVEAAEDPGAQRHAPVLDERRDRDETTAERREPFETAWPKPERPKSWDDSAWQGEGDEYGERSYAVERSPEEAREVAEELELAEAEFAYDEEGRYSRAPLYLLITLVVLIAGFLGWVLWFRSAIDEQLADQPALVGSPRAGSEEPGSRDAATVDRPDDQAAARQMETAGEEGSGTGMQQMPSGAAAETQEGETLPGDGPASEATPGSATLPPTIDLRSATQDVESQVEPERTIVSPEPEADKRLEERREEGDRPASIPDRDGTSRASEQPTRDTSSTAVVTAAYTVHVGSYKTIEQAYRDIAGLQKHGFDGRAVRTDLGSKGIWYRVYVGGYPTRAAAEEARQAILKLPEYTFAQVIRNPRP